MDKGSLARVLILKTPGDRLPVLLTADPEEDRVFSGDLVAPADLVVLLTPAQLHLLHTVRVETRNFISQNSPQIFRCGECMAAPTRGLSPETNILLAWSW